MTREQRSRCMSRIKSRNTGPEMILRKALWHSGLRYRIHGNLPGRPDVVFTASKTVVFVDGCFWHGCPIHGVKPKGNSQFWEEKLDRNRARDLRVSNELTTLGWKVLRFWEHEIVQNLPSVVEVIRLALNKISVPV